MAKKEKNTQEQSKDNEVVYSIEAENSELATDAPQVEYTKKEKPILLIFGDADFLSKIDAKLYENYTLKTTQCSASEYTIAGHKAVVELAQDYAGTLFVAKHNVLPEIAELELLNSVTEFAEFATTTARKDINYINHKGYMIYPYPAVTGAVLVVKSAKILHTAKLYNAYTQDLFLQLTMQFSAKKTYIYFEKSLYNEAHNTKKSCKTC